tara:strand:+ start:110 stop:574 length:465 start_codon:yes stop_codon:yes gene_type:complete
MTLKAKEIVDGKFWILESNGSKVATLSWNDDRYMLSDVNGTRFVENTKQLEKDLGKVSWDKLEITEISVNEVHGFPTSCKPFNPLYDVANKLPLFTKSNKSKSLYCAGYYIIRFDKGWVKSFCPKSITLDRYPFKGPFRTPLEMRTQLSAANAK